jgi:predicted outer membrane repeat protein
MEMADTYFTTGSVFEFLAGNHSVNSLLTLSNVSDIVLTGNASTTLLLGENATIRCNNVSGFHIKGLVFMLCRHQCKEDSALQILNSGLVTLSNSTFQGSWSVEVRSVISLDSDITLLNCLFEGNSGRSGGAVEARGTSTINIAGNTFIRNRGTDRGGAIHVVDGMLNFIAGRSMFVKNEALEGGAIALSGSVFSCDIDAAVVLRGNNAELGGGMYIDTSSVQGRMCNFTFTDNLAEDNGGGIHLGSHTTRTDEVLLSGVFLKNQARCGGAISCIRNAKNVALVLINITSSTGSALCIMLSSVILYESTTLINNSGVQGGGLNAVRSTLSFNDRTLFEGNTAISGGAVYLLKSSVSFNGVSKFTHNSARGDGGVLYATDTTLEFSGRVDFSFNSARNGGAVFLRREPRVILSSRSYLTLSSNNALEYGGGIHYVDNMDPSQCGYDRYTFDSDVPECFIRFKALFTLYFIHKRRIYSYHNSAGIDGSFLYGGLLDRCQNTVNKIMRIEMVSDIFKIVQTRTATQTQAITSRPYGLCVCDDPNKTLDCTGSRSRVLHRGQKFTLPLVAIAQGNTTAPTTVTAITTVSSSLKLAQNPQHLPRYCSNLTYNLYSMEEKEDLILYPEGPSAMIPGMLGL